jgi:hypothetical protein
MAYARLIFSGTVTVQQKLKEIANVCTGGITSNTQLEFANTSQSIVISTEPAGWTIADANSSIESTGTATKVQYRLSSPCVNTSKTKYCELSALASQTLSTSGTVFNTRPAAAATTGYLWVPIGSAVSANTLTNAVWYFNSYGPTGGSASTTVYNPSLSSTVTEYFISVTNRKLIVFASSGGNGPAIIMNLEFPETTYTTTWGNLPLINIFMNDSSRPAPVAEPQGTNYILSNGQSVYRTSWLTNWYDLSLSARAQTRADIASSQYYIVNPPSLTVNSAGTSVYPLYPFIDTRTSKGEGIHNYTTLTNTYYTYRSAAYTAVGDEITVGSDTYVVLTIGSATTYNRCICIKKA